MADEAAVVPAANLSKRSEDQGTEAPKGVTKGITAPKALFGSHESNVPQGLAGPLESQFATLPPAWREHLRAFLEGHAYRPLCTFVDAQIDAGKTVYPADVFRALRSTSPGDVKVVIVGQDPYHGDDKGHPQAHGLAFSVPSPVRPPPSLRNIFKEIAAEFGYVMPAHGCLDAWARQGVLLLNTVLTVEQAKAASHAKHGWEACTDTLIHELAHRHEHLVFMLWGAHAQAKRALLDARPHCVLEAPHPSPLSAHRGFLGCGHFRLANEYLVENGRAPIDWRLPETADA
ncbi:uracil-DNA glycosylase [Trinickia dinghuensis]|uniref:Uracil-DNA glycosylase n=1 Tax=Trinickia dinghuensis TaxID=2291023 RepID=A0A3D8JS70_9BURK|nr:uracil-DNA glycosylase [Trinickia dinghuensis]RDU95585.1 uracil-DNA glycosylase [Trinickia dinghuensis]